MKSTKTKIILRVLSFLVCMVFTITTVAWASPDFVYRVRVPERIGTIKERWKAPDQNQQLSVGNRELPTVIIVQDAHDNFGAQKNIAEIIHEILPQCTPENICIGVEGAVGPIDINYLKKYPLKEARTEASLALVKEGHITGAEHAAVSMDEPLALWGIEDKALFDKNFQAFYAVIQHQGSIEKTFASLNYSITDRKETLYNDSLKKFDVLEQAYRANTVSLEDFLSTLYTYTENLSLDLSSYPQSMLFQEIAQMNAALRTDSLSQEKKYKQKLALLDPQLLLEEINNITHEIKNVLAKTPREKELISIDEWMRCARNVFTLKGTRQEVKKIFPDDGDVQTSNQRETMIAQLPLNDMPGCATLLRNIEDQVRTFYSYAEQRDHALFENIMAKIAQQEKEYGMVIAGGYHAEGLKNLCRQNNISYVVITPRIESVLDRSGYMDRLLGHLFPLNPHLTSFITTSRLGALVEQIGGLEAKYQVGKKFSEEWEKAIFTNVNYRERLKRIEQDAPKNDYFSLLAQAIDTATSDIYTTLVEQKPGVLNAENLDAVIHSLIDEKKIIRALEQIVQARAQQEQKEPGEQNFVPVVVEPELSADVRNRERGRVPVPELSKLSLKTSVREQKGSGAGRIPLLSFFMRKRNWSPNLQPTLEQIIFWGVNGLAIWFTHAPYSSTFLVWCVFLLMHTRAFRTKNMPHAPPLMRIVLVAGANFASILFIIEACCMSPSSIPGYFLVPICFVLASHFHHWYDKKVRNPILHPFLLDVKHIGKPIKTYPIFKDTKKKKKHKYGPVRGLEQQKKFIMHAVAQSMLMSVPHRSNNKFEFNEIMANEQGAFTMFDGIERFFSSHPTYIGNVLLGEFQRYGVPGLVSTGKRFDENNTWVKRILTLGLKRKEIAVINDVHEASKVISRERDNYLACSGGILGFTRPHPLLGRPDSLYLNKIIIGRTKKDDQGNPIKVDLHPKRLTDDVPGLLQDIAHARGKKVSELKISLLLRDRHRDLIKQLIQSGIQVDTADFNEMKSATKENGIYENGNLYLLRNDFFPIDGLYDAPFGEETLDCVLGVGKPTEGEIMLIMSKVLGGQMQCSLASYYALQSERVDGTLKQEHAFTDRERSMLIRSGFDGEVDGTVNTITADMLGDISDLGLAIAYARDSFWDDSIKGISFADDLSEVTIHVKFIGASGRVELFPIVYRTVIPELWSIIGRYDRLRDFTNIAFFRTYYDERRAHFNAKLAEAYASFGRFDLAQRAIQDAITGSKREKNKRRYESIKYLFDAYQILKKRDDHTSIMFQAIDKLEEAIEKWPGNIIAKRLARRLYNSQADLFRINMERNERILRHILGKDLKIAVHDREKRKLLSRLPELLYMKEKDRKILQYFADQQMYTKMLYTFFKIDRKEKNRTKRFYTNAMQYFHPKMKEEETVFEKFIQKKSRFKKEEYMRDKLEYDLIKLQRRMMQYKITQSGQRPTQEYYYGLADLNRQIAEIYRQYGFHHRAIEYSERELEMYRHCNEIFGGLLPRRRIQKLARSYDEGAMYNSALDIYVKSIIPRTAFKLLHTKSREKAEQEWRAREKAEGKPLVAPWDTFIEGEYINCLSETIPEYIECIMHRDQKAPDEIDEMVAIARYWISKKLSLALTWGKNDVITYDRAYTIWITQGNYKEKLIDIIARIKDEYLAQKEREPQKKKFFGRSTVRKQGAGAGRIPLLTVLLERMGLPERWRAVQPFTEQVLFWGINMKLCGVIANMGMPVLRYAPTILVWSMFFIIHFIRTKNMPHAPPKEWVGFVAMINMIPILIMQYVLQHSLMCVSIPVCIAFYLTTEMHIWLERSGREKVEQIIQDFVHTLNRPMRVRSTKTPLPDAGDTSLLDSSAPHQPDTEKIFIPTIRNIFIFFSRVNLLLFFISGIMYLNGYEIGKSFNMMLSFASCGSLCILCASVITALSKITTRDPLTGLYNRRHLSETLPAEISRARHTARPLACLMLDIDLFKRVNDTYGHAVGDAVLKKFAAVVSETVWDKDVVYRYGGEEFTVLLPETSGDEAKTAAEKIRLAVETAIMDTYRGVDILVTTSIGIAVYYPKESDISLSQEELGEKLITNADQALYMTKDHGRNCCLFFDDSDPQFVEREKTYRARKKIEKKLREQIKFLKNLVALSPLPIMITDEHGNIESASPSLYRYLRYESDDVIGKHFALLLSQNMRKPVAKRIVYGLEEKKTVKEEHVELIAKDGQPKFMNIYAKSIYNDDGTIYKTLTILQDITSEIDLTAERQKLQEILVREKKTLENILNLIPMMVLTLDNEGQITFINEAGANLLGYTAEELIEKNWFTTCLPERFRDEVWSFFKKLTNGEATEGAPYENPILCKDGTEVMVYWQNVFLRNESGAFTGLVASGIDISEKDARETLKKEKEKQQLISNISHEIKNPITVIEGACELLDEALGHDDKKLIAENIQTLEQPLGRIKKLIDSLMIISNQRQLHIGIYDLGTIVNEIWPLLPQQQQQFIREKNIASGLYVEGDKDDLWLALYHLIKNAAEAAHEIDGIVNVAVEGNEKDVSMTIRDTGQGGSVAEVKKWFMPFYTTRRGEKKVGLGNTMAQVLIERYEGTIDVQSKPGVGTTVTVRFPRVEKEEVPIAIPDTITVPQAGIKKILIVDDELGIRQMWPLMLKKYETYTADDGTTALSLIDSDEHQAEPFDLIISDFTMPEMNGDIFVTKYREYEKKKWGKSRRIPVVMITGYGEGATLEIIDKLMAGGMVTELKSKPVSMKDLKDTVASYDQVDEILSDDVSSEEENIKKETEKTFEMFDGRLRHDLNGRFSVLLGYLELLQDDGVSGLDDSIKMITLAEKERREIETLSKGTFTATELMHNKNKVIAACEKIEKIIKPVKTLLMDRLEKLRKTSALDTVVEDNVSEIVGAISPACTLLQKIILEIKENESEWQKELTLPTNKEDAVPTGNSSGAHRRIGLPLESVEIHNREKILEKSMRLNATKMQEKILRFSIRRFGGEKKRIKVKAKLLHFDRDFFPKGIYAHYTYEEKGNAASPLIIAMTLPKHIRQMVLNGDDTIDITDPIIAEHIYHEFCESEAYEEIMTVDRLARAEKKQKKRVSDKYVYSASHILACYDEIIAFSGPRTLTPFHLDEIERMTFDECEEFLKETVQQRKKHYVIIKKYRGERGLTIFRRYEKKLRYAIEQKIDSGQLEPLVDDLLETVRRRYHTMPILSEDKRIKKNHSINASSFTFLEEEVSPEYMIFPNMSPHCQISLSKYPFLLGKDIYKDFRELKLFILMYCMYRLNVLTRREATSRVIGYFGELNEAQRGEIMRGLALIAREEKSDMRINQLIRIMHDHQKRNIVNKTMTILKYAPQIFQLWGRKAPLKNIFESKELRMAVQEFIDMRGFMIPSNDVDGTRIHAVLGGNLASPATICILPGWTETALSVTRLVALLEDTYKVIVIERRAHGESENSKDVSQISMEHNNDDLKTVLKFFRKTMGLRGEIFIGHSEGGMDSMYFWQFAGGFDNIADDTLSAWLPMCTTAENPFLSFQSDTISKSLVHLQPVIEVLLKELTSYPMVKSGINGFLNMFGTSYESKVKVLGMLLNWFIIKRGIVSKEQTQHIEMFVKEFLRGMKREGLEQLRAMLKHDQIHFMPNVKKPTIVIIGEYDQVITKEAQEKFADSLPQNNARKEEIKQAGHLTNLFAEEVVPYVDELAETKTIPAMCAHELAELIEDPSYVHRILIERFTAANFRHVRSVEDFKKKVLSIIAPFGFKDVFKEEYIRNITHVAEIFFARWEGIPGRVEKAEFFHMISKNLAEILCHMLDDDEIFRIGVIHVQRRYGRVPYDANRNIIDMLDKTRKAIRIKHASVKKLKEIILETMRISDNPILAKNVDAIVKNIKKEKRLLKGLKMIFAEHNQEIMLYGRGQKPAIEAFQRGTKYANDLLINPWLGRTWKDYIGTIIPNALNQISTKKVLEVLNENDPSLSARERLLQLAELFDAHAPKKTFDSPKEKQPFSLRRILLRNPFFWWREKATLQHEEQTAEQKTDTPDKITNGMIHHGEKSRKIFDQREKEIRKNDITDEYKNIIEELLLPLKENIEAFMVAAEDVNGERSEFDKEICDIKETFVPALRAIEEVLAALPFIGIYGYESIVCKERDFHFGEYDRIHNILYLATDFIGTLKSRQERLTFLGKQMGVSNYRVKLLDEYVLHEVLCPYLGHTRTRELQKLVFGENYSDPKKDSRRKIILAGKKDNGFLGDEVRAAIVRKLSFPRQVTSLLNGARKELIKPPIQVLLERIKNINEKRQAEKEAKRRIKEKKEDNKKFPDGMIQKGERSRAIFDAHKKEYQKNDITHEYKDRIIVLFDHFYDQVCTIIGTAVAKEVREDLETMRMCGYEGIVVDPEDYHLGEYDKKNNELYLATDLITELELYEQKRSKPGNEKHFIDEYLLHEVLCPFVGHEQAIFYQQKIFPQHYTENKKKAHQTTINPYKGMLGTILRRFIDRKVVLQHMVEDIINLFEHESSRVTFPTQSQLALRFNLHRSVLDRYYWKDLIVLLERVKHSRIQQAMKTLKKKEKNRKEKTSINEQRKRNVVRSYFVKAVLQEAEIFASRYGMLDKALITDSIKKLLRFPYDPDKARSYVEYCVHTGIWSSIDADILMSLDLETKKESEQKAAQFHTRELVETIYNECVLFRSQDIDDDGIYNCLGNGISYGALRAIYLNNPNREATMQTMAHAKWFKINIDDRLRRQKGTVVDQQRIRVQTFASGTREAKVTFKRIDFIFSLLSPLRNDLEAGTILFEGNGDYIRIYNTRTQKVWRFPIVDGYICTSDGKRIGDEYHVRRKDTSRTVHLLITDYMFEDDVVERHRKFGVFYRNPEECSEETMWANLARLKAHVRKKYNLSEDTDELTIARTIAYYLQLSSLSRYLKKDRTKEQIYFMYKAYFSHNRRAFKQFIQKSVYDIKDILQDKVNNSYYDTASLASVLELSLPLLMIDFGVDVFFDLFTPEGDLKHILKILMLSYKPENDTVEPFVFPCNGVVKKELKKEPEKIEWHNRMLFSQTLNKAINELKTSLRSDIRASDIPAYRRLAHWFDKYKDDLGFKGKRWKDAVYAARERKFSLLLLQIEGYKERINEGLDKKNPYEFKVFRSMYKEIHTIFSQLKELYSIREAISEELDQRISALKDDMNILVTIVSEVVPRNRNSLRAGLRNANIIYGKEVVSRCLESSEMTQMIEDGMFNMMGTEVALASASMIIPMSTEVRMVIFGLLAMSFIWWGMQMMMNFKDRIDLALSSGSTVIDEDTEVYENLPLDPEHFTALHYTAAGHDLGTFRIMKEAFPKLKNIFYVNKGYYMFNSSPKRDRRNIASIAHLNKLYDGLEKEHVIISEERKQYHESNDHAWDLLSLEEKETGRAFTMHLIEQDHFTYDATEIAGPTIHVVKVPGDMAHLSQWSGFYPKMISQMKIGDLLFITGAALPLNSDDVSDLGLRNVDTALFDLPAGEGYMSTPINEDDKSFLFWQKGWKCYVKQQHINKESLRDVWYQDHGMKPEEDETKEHEVEKVIVRSFDVTDQMQEALQQMAEEEKGTIRGFIQQGKESKDRFERLKDGIHRYPVTDQYRDRILELYETHKRWISLDAAQHAALEEKIKTMQIYGYRSIILDPEDYHLGEYDHEKNILYLSIDLMESLEDEEQGGRQSLVDEYLIHEILCHYMGHENAIFAQQDMFEEHYMEGDCTIGCDDRMYMPAYGGHDSRPFKGLLGVRVREFINMRYMRQHIWEDGAVVIGDTVRVEGIPIRSEDIPDANHYIDILTRAIHVVHFRYPQLINAVRHACKEILIVKEREIDFDFDGQLRVPMHYLDAADMNRKDFDYLVEHVLLPGFICEHQDFEDAVRTACPSIIEKIKANGDTEGKSFESDRPLKRKELWSDVSMRLFVKKVFWRWRHYRYTMNAKLTDEDVLIYVLNEIYGQSNQKPPVSYDPPAQISDVFLAVSKLHIAPLTKIVLPLVHEINDFVRQQRRASAKSDSFDGSSEPELPSIENIGDRLLEAQYEALGKVDGSVGASKRAFIDADQDIKDNAKKHAYTMKLFISPKIQKSAFYPLLKEAIEQVAEFDEGLNPFEKKKHAGLNIVFVDTEAIADLILASERDSFDDTKTLYFSTDENIFTKQIIVFPMFFIRLIAHAMKEEGEIDIDLRHFSLTDEMEKDSGKFAIHSTIIQSVNNKIVQFMKSRFLVQTAA